MNNASVLNSHFHPFTQVRAKLGSAVHAIVSLLDDEEGGDSYEMELKRMIEVSGMVTPHYDAVALESWD
jgi:hypothetical protein